MLKAHRQHQSSGAELQGVLLARFGAEVSFLFRDGIFKWVDQWMDDILLGPRGRSGERRFALSQSEEPGVLSVLSDGEAIRIRVCLAQRGWLVSLVDNTLVPPRVEFAPVYEEQLRHYSAYYDNIVSGIESGTVNSTNVQKIVTMEVSLP
jgi:hypothetical protein